MESSSEAPADIPRSPKLLERMRAHLRTRHHSIRTEEAYLDWARRFILFHGKQHPQEMGAAEVEAFLSHLAVDRQVSASTKNQAKAAILYLSLQVLVIKYPETGLQLGLTMVFSPRPYGPSTHDRMHAPGRRWSGVIMSIPNRCSARCAKRRGSRASPSRVAARVTSFLCHASAAK
jgi:hypothetical protein